jgi:hypothetical protein
MASSANQDAPLATATTDTIKRLDLCWTPIIAGAIIAASVSFVLLTFGSSIGLAVVSPSATWRDTSWLLALLGGIWLLLTSLASFALGGYFAGAFRPTISTATPQEIEFRDGSHGLAVWALAILIGAALTSAAPPAGGTRPAAFPTTSNLESFLAFELDQLFRSDRKPDEVIADDSRSQLRAQAARIFSSGLGSAGIAPDDRSYLVRLVMSRTGIAQPDAEARVDKIFANAKVAVSRARRGAVILAFMIGTSLLIGAVAAWLAATSGGKHRDGSLSPEFWRRWEVDRSFFIR